MHEPVAESIRIRVGHADASGKPGEYDFIGQDTRTEADRRQKTAILIEDKTAK